jgi:hypothetical protein
MPGERAGWAAALLRAGAATRVGAAAWVAALVTDRRAGSVRAVAFFLPPFAEPRGAEAPFDAALDRARGATLPAR